MADLEQSTNRLLAAYKTAVHDRDIDAFMRLYDPKVRVFDAWGIWLYEDAERWQRAVEAWFGSLGTERVVVSFDDVMTWGDDNLASLSAVVTYASVSAQGEPLRSMQNRLSWLLKTRSHQLRVLHEHTSAPIGFDDMKAILIRPAGR